MPIQHTNTPAYQCVCENTPASQTLNDFCEFVPPDDGRALCEYKNDNLYYRVNLTTNELPIVLCSFEKYIDTANLPGRKTDYLAVGRYRNNTYVIFIELRKNLLNDQQWENKKDQVEQAMQLLCKTETPSGVYQHANIAKIFTDAAGDMLNHKVIGVVIPAQRAKRRIEQARDDVNMGGKTNIILPIFPTRGLQPTLSWNELLEAIGL